MAASQRHGCAVYKYQKNLNLHIKLATWLMQ